MKLWLTFLAGPNSFFDIQEMVEPIRRFFNGLVVTYHGNRDDPEAQYLEMMKGNGYIVYLPYSGRHDHSRNAALWSGAIEQGDWIVQTDVLERPNAEFVRNEITIHPGLTAQAFNTYFYYGKPFLFQYHESLAYQGTPHEGLRRLDGQMRAFELSNLIPDESKVRLNVRPIKRTDPYHWVGHYVRYYLATPWGSNHCLLGNEHRGDPMKLYQEREALRIEVREYMHTMGMPLNEAGLRQILTQSPMPEKMKGYVNRERILNDAYRYWVLDDKSVKDDHTWAGMITV